MTLVTAVVTAVAVFVRSDDVTRISWQNAVRYTGSYRRTFRVDARVMKIHVSSLRCGMNAGDDFAMGSGVNESVSDLESDPDGRGSDRGKLPSTR